MNRLERAKSGYLSHDNRDGVEIEIIGDYRVSHHASKLPWMSEDQFEDLCDSIEEHGLKTAILLNDDGHVVEGRNRLLACLELGVDPTFDYATLGEVQEIMIANLSRRHLTAGQRAMLYVQLTGSPSRHFPVDEGVKTNQDEQEGATTGGETAPQAASKSGSKPAAEKKKPSGGKKNLEEKAAEAGTSQRTMQDAQKIAKTAIPEVAKAVSDGVLSIEQGLVIAGLEKNQQHAALQSGTVAETVATEKDKKTKRQFHFSKWSEGIDNKLSKILASVPEDLRDRCHRHIADRMGSTVSLEKSPEILRDASTICREVEEILEQIPKQERKLAVQELAKAYSPKRSWESSEIPGEISRLIQEMSAGDRKAFIQSFAEQHGLTAEKKPRIRKSIEPPTLDEVKAYISEKNITIDAEHFHAHYKANGWKQANGNPIKDWQAAVTTWTKNNAKFNGASSKNGSAGSVDRSQHGRLSTDKVPVKKTGAERLAEQRAAVKK